MTESDKRELSIGGVNKFKKLFVRLPREVLNPNPNIIFDSKDLTTDQLVKFLEKGILPTTKLNRSSSS